VPDPWLLLELEGHGGLSLPCLLRAKSAERGSAAVLPGGAFREGRIGGTPARPEVAFVRALLQEQGLGVREVWADDSLAAADAESARPLAGVLDELRDLLAAAAGPGGARR
jgi:hypothetical protein